MTRPMDPAVRFWSKVDVRGEDDCWEWQASKCLKSYGRFNLTKRKRVQAHRWAYEDAVGPIPEGLHIDHLCRNPPCVNPKHLEPVTPRENIARGVRWIPRTHCYRGHPLTPENVAINNAGRFCRTCKRASGRAYEERKRARKLAKKS